MRQLSRVFPMDRAYCSSCVIFFNQSAEISCFSLKKKNTSTSYHLVKNIQCRKRRENLFFCFLTITRVNNKVADVNKHLAFCISP